MLSLDSGTFLQLPEASGKRVLHPAKVLGLKDEVYTAAMEEPDLSIEADQDVLIFYEERRQFMQQAARILTVSSDETPPVIEFKTTGDPVSAENRQNFRVSAVMAGLIVGIGAEPDCPLLDVSCTGFSAIVEQHHDIGSVVAISLDHEDTNYRGSVCVQSVRKLSRGRLRYGFHCIDADKSAGTMPQGLRKLCLGLQREQLRRLACVE